MTEISPPYGDQPEVPSDRVTEAQLFHLEAAAHDVLARTSVGEPLVLNHPAALCVAGLARELRRYRALLLGLAAAADAAPGFETCACPLPEHVEGCPVPALEAEVKAIRAERKNQGG